MNVNTGDRFGRLIVIGETVKRYAPCRCDCGTEKKVRIDHLITGKTRSCGCYLKEFSKVLHTTHGAGSRRTSDPQLYKLYRLWSDIKKRCYNPNYKEWKYYGGRGINMSDDWVSDFRNFHRDMGLVPEGKSIDRIDFNKGYCKENCRWATPTEQSRNSRWTKLSMEKATKIRELRKNGASTKDLSSMFGVCNTEILAVINNVRWQAL